MERARSERVQLVKFYFKGQVIRHFKFSLSRPSYNTISTFSISTLVLWRGLCFKLFLKASSKT